MPKFVPKERKHKVRQRLGQDGQIGGDDAAAADSNAMEILPSSSTEKEQKRQRMKESLRAQQSKISGKKQRRLDKYIVRKLS